jgi:HupE / UreJ protein
MNAKFLVAAAILLSLGAGAFAHRLDEYLQATLISIEKDHAQVSMRLIPGVAVSSLVLVSIDTNGDGMISDTEQRTYAERVLHDLSITVDGTIAIPALISLKFPTIEEMKEGLGEVQLEFTVALPPGGSERTIILQNHHQNQISAYLVNCLVPGDPSIKVLAQNRNETQSFYQLKYSQPATVSAQPSVKAASSVDGWRDAVGFASIFRLGMRHIAEGTDHLLFLIALLLPAPLLVSGSRWAGFAGARQSALQILKVVTAFTIGHSITLALAALGLLRAPARPIEVLIALSILVSAAHAFRPIFPGRESAIAAFFGLIHGLAFATTLGELGLSRWQRVASILGFNLGIETMQLIVVASIMPSFILLSRTRAYPFLRIAGALFAAVASASWIAERLLGVHTSVDVIVNAVAHTGVWIAAGLFSLSVIFSLSSHQVPRKDVGHCLYPVPVNHVDPTTAFTSSDIC